MRTIAALFLASVCWSQQPEFEVASVKPNTSLRQGSDFNLMPGGGLHAIHVTLKEMIVFAYGIGEQKLIGATGWMDNDRYDVMAKPAKGDAPAQSSSDAFSGVRLMLRGLLADRFRLSVHTETREMPIYALVVAKGGPHLQLAKSDGPTIHNQNGRVECKKVTMKQFVEGSLAYHVGRTVVDKTGLTGEYDFEIKFVDDRAAAAPDVSGPDFLTAMLEQTGLRLESQKGPVEVMVVDRAEKASAN